MDCVDYSELWWWATEGDWSMRDGVLLSKQGHRTAADQPREEKGINKLFFFPTMLQSRH